MRCSAIFTTILVLAAHASAQPPPETRPIDQAKLSAIEELISLSKLDQMQKQMFPQVQQMMVNSIEKAIPAEMQSSPDRSKVAAELRDFENRLFDLMKDRMDFARMKPDYLRLYDETFTSEEVAGIVAFYKTPAGQAYLAKLPILTSKSMEMVQRMMADFMPQLQKMNADWLEEMKKKYSDSGAK